jgi:hypothetical protein
MYPATIDKTIPLTTYTIVTFQPNIPRNIATETASTNGDEIKKANVTPSGIPPFTKPINKGTEEQEQNGVIVPKKEAKK